jgi:hypothetical protein
LSICFVAGYRLHRTFWQADLPLKASTARS